MKIEHLISIDEKRTFLNWFVSHYELKSKECNWLLNYILNDDHLLRLIHFVETVDGCPRAIRIADYTSSFPAFMYRKERVETSETEKAFHDIRLHQDVPIYVQLDFKEAKKAIPYLSIIEDNPYEGLDSNRFYGLVAKEVVMNSEREFKKEVLYKAIDQALEEGDHEAFQLLSVEFKTLTKDKEETKD